MTAIEESKNHVTHYAFKVDQDLLGRPLAKPYKRLFAVFADMILIGVLTTLNALVLAGLIGITSFSAFIKLVRDPQKRVLSSVPLFISLLCGLIVFVSLSFSDKPLNFSFGDAEVPVELPRGSDDDATAPETEGYVQRKQDESPQPSMIDWLNGALSDLGLSFGWAALYFSVMMVWMSGQTPGKRLFGITVLRVDGGTISLWDAFGRYGGYSAGLATGLLGFLQIYWDPNRQAIHDKISETVVVDLRKPSIEV